jgi:hypothetical protein
MATRSVKVSPVSRLRCQTPELPHECADGDQARVSMIPQKYFVAK